MGLREMPLVNRAGALPVSVTQWNCMSIVWDFRLGSRKCSGIGSTKSLESPWRRSIGATSRTSVMLRQGQRGRIERWVISSVALSEVTTDLFSSITPTCSVRLGCERLKG